jgi:hypothetical protein
MTYSTSDARSASTQKRIDQKREDIFIGKVMITISAAIIAVLVLVLAISSKHSIKIPTSPMSLSDTQQATTDTQITKSQPSKN